MTGTERKVFQKYYPPDYDPRKLPKVKGQRNIQFVQRVMAPFNMTCNTCGEYIYKGKKFNMRRETAEGEDYLGLKIFRFYFRCPNCLAEITFKTDLENCDYAAEHGSTRLFEAHKLYMEKQKEKEKQEEEDKTNPMKMLENRTKMSRAELDALGDLEEIREMNRRLATVDYEGLLTEYADKQAQQLRPQEEKDEQFVQSLFRTMDGQKIKRILDDDDEAADDKPSSSGITFSSTSSATSTAKPSASSNSSNSTATTTAQTATSILTSGAVSKPGAESGVVEKKLNKQKDLLSGLVVVRKKPKLDNSASSAVATTTTTTDLADSGKNETSVNALGALGDYGSGSSGESDQDS